MRTRSLTRALGGFAATLAVLAMAAPAFAHVDADGDTDASGVTTVTFSFTHGCVESPTTSLRIQLPSNVSDVKAENPPGWTSQVGTSELTWTGGSIANGTKGEFVATMKVTGNTGDTVFFPTIQGCVQGANSWIDRSMDPEAENAAPRIVIGATAGATGADEPKETPGSRVAPATTATTGTTGTTATSKATATSAPATSGTAAPTSTTSSNSNIGLIIAVIAAVIIGGGVTALFMRNRTKP